MKIINKEKTILIPFAGSGYFPKQTVVDHYLLSIPYPAIILFRDYDNFFNNGFGIGIGFEIRTLKMFHKERIVTRFTYQNS